VTPARNPAAGPLRLALVVVSVLCATTTVAQTSPDALVTPPAATVNELHAEFKRRLDTGENAAAAEQAQALVRMLEARPATGSTEALQVALMNLGLAQQRAGDYVGAESSYQRVVELIEASGRPANPRLARAYAGLAGAYHAAKRYDLAEPAVERAIALNRRSEGLFNAEQLPLLEQQADSLTELGRAEEALQAHRYALRVVERRYGTGSLEYADALESVGRWYTRVGAYEASRVTLRRAIEVTTARSGEDSLDLVGPLTALARNARRWMLDPRAREAAAESEGASMFHDRVMPTPPQLSMSTVSIEGLRALERAAEIVDGRPDPSPALAAQVHTQLGDWHQLLGSKEQALSSYRQAWLAASRAPSEAGEPPLTTTLFGQPTMVYYDAPAGWNRYAGRPADEVELRNAGVELTVSAAGTVTTARIVEPTGIERLDENAVRAAESARYRPRFVDGAPAEAVGVRFVQPFYVLREKDEEAPAAAAPSQERG